VRRSFFQNGALVLSSSIKNSQAANAALRCALATRINTIWSLMVRSPTRWISDVTGLHLEHYPAMTQLSLEKLVAEAHTRWPIQGCTLIHRVGDLTINDQIVLILVASAHRKAAFAACEFLIDELKTSAPFWKKERRTDGSLRWVHAE
jgi:molybdopterin synthase catalytic subunit